MERHNYEFNVYYCYRLEKNLYTFWRRVNNLVVFLQIFLSTMVFSGVAGTQWYGALMASLTIGAFVFRPDVAMANAKSQLRRYSSLKLKMSNLDAEELHSELGSIKLDDSDSLGHLENPAFNRATIEYGQSSYIVQLSFMEKLTAWFVGDLPPSK